VEHRIDVVCAAYDCQWTYAFWNEIVIRRSVCELAVDRFVYIKPAPVCFGNIQIRKMRRSGSLGMFSFNCDNVCDGFIWRFVA
jgi:hypothetical protein